MRYGGVLLCVSALLTPGCGDSLSGHDGSGSAPATPASVAPAASPAYRDQVRLGPVEPPRARTEPLHAVEVIYGDPTLPCEQQAPMLPAPSGQQRVADLAIGAHVTDPVDMKLLVISADGTETDFRAVTAFLDRIGVPYSTLIAKQTPLVSSMLWDGQAHGYYQGVILATGNLVYWDTGASTWLSAFDANQWATLWEYEAMFGVRQVTSYTLPWGAPDTYGLNLVSSVSTTDTPLTVQLTAEGRTLFPYLNPAVAIPIRNAWTYLATVATPEDTTPLVVTPDGQFAIASVHTYADGRQNLAVTAANDPAAMHSLLLSYGVIDWVTKGTFLGERHVNIGPQVDDMFLDADLWDVSALSDTTGLTYRITGDDYRELIAWQGRARPIQPSLALEMAFNAWGTTGVYSPDTLTPAVKASSSAFNWTSHTYDHENLDTLSYKASLTELKENHNLAKKPLKLANYIKSAMVQPDVSGLHNPDFLRAAGDFGIRYVVSDTSQPGWDNPSPNAGFYSTLDPRIFIVPRRPANLFWNVSTPAEWVSEYNAFYAPGGRFPYWDHELVYSEILDFEGEVWLRQLLNWEVDPHMFHQANLRAYDGGASSLLGDLIDMTVAKYTQYYTLPIRNLRETEVGALMQRRMAYNASGVTATLVPSAPGSPTRCASITLVATAPAVVPMTGIAYGTEQEVYGGEKISYITLAANTPVTLPGSACQ